MHAALVGTDLAKRHSSSPLRVDDSLGQVRCPTLSLSHITLRIPISFYLVSSLVATSTYQGAYEWTCLGKVIQ